jgi:hypothetical protein
LRLCEDGTPLGPPHVIHATIAAQGGGRYSHWNRRLLFSTSDGSDPNANGRRYSVFLGQPTLQVLGFGSCHVHDAVARLHARGLAYSLWSSPTLSYSPREALQLADFHGGRLDIPAHLHALTVAGEGEPVARVAMRGADIVFLELGIAIDIGLGPYWIVRSQLLKCLMQPIAALGKEAHQLVYRWYHQGLLKQDERVRLECAAHLRALIPRTGLDPRLAADIVMHARGLRQGAGAVSQTILELRERLRPRAFCLLSTQNAFTPDGRPVSWPGNFPRQLDAVCSRLGLPLLHPSRLVAQHGSAFSLDPDLHHYTPQFLSVLADEMLAMGRRVLDAAPEQGATDGGNPMVALERI